MLSFCVVPLPGSFSHCENGRNAFCNCVKAVCTYVELMSFQEYQMSQLRKHFCGKMSSMSHTVLETEFCTNIDTASCGRYGVFAHFWRLGMPNLLGLSPEAILRLHIVSCLNVWPGKQFFCLVLLLRAAAISNWSFLGLLDFGLSLRLVLKAFRVVRAIGPGTSSIPDSLVPVSQIYETRRGLHKEDHYF